MNFVRTFDSVPAEDCSLWAVAYPGETDEDGNPTDVFQRLLDEWNDTEKLASFFLKNQKDLSTWEQTLTIDAAIDWALDEAQELEEKLEGIVSGQGQYKHFTLWDIFEPLHENVYALRRANEKLRKGKANHGRTMLRFYAVELDDGTMVISGGGIKVTDGMEPKHLEDEEQKLNILRDYINREKIVSRDGLF